MRTTLSIILAVGVAFAVATPAIADVVLCNTTGTDAYDFHLETLSATDLSDNGDILRSAPFGPGVADPGNGGYTVDFGAAQHTKKVSGAGGCVTLGGVKLGANDGDGGKGIIRIANYWWTDTNHVKIVASFLPDRLHDNFGTDIPAADLLSGSYALLVVPEPGTWMTMLAGFGCAGAMLRRRRTVGLRLVAVR